ncbi:MAG: RNA 2',3'-cyclic phosphodiesterase [Oscillospiraceae bacterium]|nr:RNA 2',3'-cyclic phosphodiesterase [Oscillospiraceae bacterium]
MRLFLAILPDPDMRDALCAVQHELRRRGVEGNFTRPENLHLTLAFIGDYPDPDAVLEALSELRFEPFSLALDGLGAFGELWWAGLRGNEALDALVRRLRRALGDAGIPFDRKSFLPHITLVRKAQLRRGTKLGELPLPAAETRAARVSLMLSTRGKSGMIYTELGAVGAREGRA